MKISPDNDRENIFKIILVTPATFIAALCLYGYFLFTAWELLRGHPLPCIGGVLVWYGSSKYSL